MNQKIIKNCTRKKKKRKELLPSFFFHFLALAPPPLKLTLAYRAGDSHGKKIACFEHYLLLAAPSPVALIIVASRPRRAKKWFISFLLPLVSQKQRKKDEDQIFFKSSPLATFPREAHWLLELSWADPIENPKENENLPLDSRKKSVSLFPLFQAHENSLPLEPQKGAFSQYTGTKKKEISSSFPFRLGNEKKRKIKEIQRKKNRNSWKRVSPPPKTSIFPPERLSKFPLFTRKPTRQPRDRLPKKKIFFFFQSPR